MRGNHEVTHEGLVSTITVTSPLSGERTQLTVDRGLYVLWLSGTNVQDAFPMLSRTECEFLITGFTADEQASVFGED